MDGKAWQWVADISDELGYQLGVLNGQHWVEYNTLLLAMAEEIGGETDTNTNAMDCDG